MIGGINIREFGKYIHKYDNKFGFSMSVKGKNSKMGTIDSFGYR